MFVVAGCGDDAERDDKGAITTGGEASAFNLKVGDCFDDPDSGGQIADVAAVPCTDPHDNEVFGLEKNPADGDFPGTEQVNMFGEEKCSALFESYVGTAPAESSLQLATLNPTKDSWEQEEDRTAVCVLSGEEKLTGSKKGSAE